MAKTEIIKSTITEMQAEELWAKGVMYAEEFATNIGDVLARFDQTNGWAALGYNSWTQFIKAYAKAIGKTERRIWQLHQANQKKLTDGTKNGDFTEIISVDLDEVGRDLPEPLVDIFSRSDKEIKEVQQYLNSALKCVSDHANKLDPLWQTMPFQTITTAINDAKRALKLSKPYAVCPYCGGDGENCDACKGRGWLNEMQWRVVPEEIKQCA